jgi:hypothetical protein
VCHGELAGSLESIDVAQCLFKPTSYLKKNFGGNQ